MCDFNKLKLLNASIYFSVITILLWSCADTPTRKIEPLPGQSFAEFPKMTVGDTWTVDSWIGVLNSKVFKVNPDGGFIIKLQGDSDKKRWLRYFDNQYRLIKVINMKTGEIAKIPTPPAKRLDFPLYIGKKWNDKYNGPSDDGDNRDYENFYTLKNIEMVNTKAGSFIAYKIHRKHRDLDYPRFRGMENYWYVPELKVVIKSKPTWRKGYELLNYQLADNDEEITSVETTPVVFKHDKKEDEKNANVIKDTPREIINTSGTRWAVIIGISQYKDTRIPSLRYAAADAKSFYDWLISPNGGKYAPARVKLLIDTQATGTGMKKSLFEWLGKVLEEDIVTIFFAGHGSPQSPDNPKNLFLLPHDVKYDSIATTGFPMWDIETALKRFIKAGRVIIITDACHAGGVGQAFDVARRNGRGLKVVPISSNLHNLSHIGDGICILTASDDDQFSQESKQWGGGHGVFTYYLLKGLNGNADYNKDRVVSLGEIIPYLSEQVRRETSNAQTPTVAGRFDPALTIGR